MSRKIVNSNIGYIYYSKITATGSGGQVLLFDIAIICNIYLLQVTTPDFTIQGLVKSRQRCQKARPDPPPLVI
jgi:hypothetical protein